MRIVSFINQLGFGGTEKAAVRWARGLADRGHAVDLLSLQDGPRRTDLERNSINVHIVAADAKAIQQKLETLRPEVIHAHAPGHPHQGDVLGEALALMPKIPVVQTNIFGQLDNPKEDAWTDFRLFISWTSCVQAARRYFRPLNEDFFKHASVVVYPLDPEDGPSAPEIETFRRGHGIQPKEIVFGRLSRPEPNKWTDLAIHSFRIAAAKDDRLKLLLREPPPAVRHGLKNATDSKRFIILPATSDAAELSLTMASLDAVLHTSVIGESFGYGIAEPMNFGQPVIANSTPWLDQAQIELVRHGECGFIASTPKTMADAILKLADDVNLRTRLGNNARTHIRRLANPQESTDRLESALQAAATGRENPRASDDLAKARIAASYLDKHQFGHSLGEQIALRPLYYRVRFHQWRRHLKTQTAKFHNMDGPASRTAVKTNEEVGEHERHIASMVDYYARTAPKYNLWHSDLKTKGAHNFAVSKLVELAKAQNYGTVLDVCCGTGRAVKICLENGIDTQGVDISQELINEGIRTWNLPADRFSCADATQLPFPDNQFDATCVLGALHHSALPSQIIQEMIRVTRSALILSDEGNHWHRGIKIILQRLKIFSLVYRLIFRRAPRTTRRITVSAEDGPAYDFSTNEILPIIKRNFSEVRTYQFYRFHNFNIVSSRLPLLFARNVVVIADKKRPAGHS